MYNPPDLQYLPLAWVESLVGLRLQLHKTTDTLCSQSLGYLLKTNPFKLWIMKKITTLLSSNTKNAQVQETLLVTAILAVIVTVSVLFI